MRFILMDVTWFAVEVLIWSLLKIFVAKLQKRYLANLTVMTMPVKTVYFVM